ncbi:Nucleoside 2-deoxyribosyltransferase [Candidatus Terasakiella magnetica]|nr:Nucleoside 2-deoxyribosyltransferase [Candidatus Terasakiella magnetica]
MTKVYLAGPAALHPAAKALLDYLVEECAKQGLEGVGPFTPGPDIQALPAPERAAAIRQGNLERIRSCDMVVACISPFRGPAACPGTTWEMGYAEALGKPVVVWSEEPRPYIDRIPHDRDDDGRVFCRQHGMLVEDFGLTDSLVFTSGAVTVQPDFESALKAARRLAG